MLPSAAPSPRALFAVVVAATALIAAAPAAAAPCWKQVQQDWVDNGRIDRLYAPSCYDEAIDRLPPDILSYSNAADVIGAAKRRVLVNKDRQTEGVGPITPGGGPGNGGSDPGAGGDDGPFQSLLNGPAALGDVPLPLLILAGISLLLIAAGGAGLVSRRLQERRLAPATEAGPDAADGPP